MLLKILFAHALGDYFLQGEYLAMNKGKDNYLLCIHAILYTFAVSLIFGNEISQLWYWLILLIILFIFLSYLTYRFLVLA